MNNFFYQSKMNKLNKIEYLGYSDPFTKRVTRYLHIKSTHFRDTYANEVLREGLIC